MNELRKVINQAELEEEKTNKDNEWIKDPLISYIF